MKFRQPRHRDPHGGAAAGARLSYAEPVETYATNVMGTVHLLEAVRRTPGVRAVVNVTTDKCYEKSEWAWGYRETSPWAATTRTAAARAAPNSSRAPTAARSSSCGGTGAGDVARAGNVIGGGDWATDRLVPDILRAFERGEPVVIRNPHATRPWQHVLEPLSGYLTLAQRLWDGGAAFRRRLELRPRDEDAQAGAWIVERLVPMGRRRALAARRRRASARGHYLKLDISKARARLGWGRAGASPTILQHIVAWHQGLARKQDVRALCLRPDRPIHPTTRRPSHHDRSPHQFRQEDARPTARRDRGAGQQFSDCRATRAFVPGESAVPSRAR
jgi:CDP-glucose 4,6-dehydratase